jgi:hypothetical protein
LTTASCIRRRDVGLADVISQGWPLLLGKMVPAFECGAQGFGRDRAPLGTRAWQTVRVRPDDACPKLARLARPCAEPVPQAERRTATIGCEHHNPFSRARRSGRHMVAHPTVASPSAAAQVPPKHGGTAVWVRPNTRFAVQPDQRKTAPVLARATALIQRPASPT